MIKNNILLPHRILVILLVCISINAIGQKRGNEKIKALKIAHITQELNLTSEEAQNFWPIYNAHITTMNALRKKEKTTVSSDMQLLGRLTEKEATTVLQELQDIKKRRFEAKEQLIADLGKVISNKKIVLLSRAEDNFKHTLLRQYGDQKKMIDLRRKAIEERRKAKLDAKMNN